MKKILLFATVVAMSLAVAMPMNAQTHKDKKAAKKEQWEMRQQFIKDSTERANQAKLDAIDRENKAKEEAAAKAKLDAERAEQARAAAAAEEAARQKKAEELAAAQEVDIVDEPCMEAGSTDSYIRARGIGVSLQQQTARTKAQTVAVRDLGAKIGTTVQALIKMYSNEESMSVMSDQASGDAMTLSEKYESMVKQKVDQNLSYSTFCEKTRTYMQNNKKIYKCYMTVQAGKDEVLKPVFEGLQGDASTKLNIDYNRFSEEFDKEFNKGGIE